MLAYKDAYIPPLVAPVNKQYTIFKCVFTLILVMIMFDGSH